MIEVNAKFEQAETDVQMPNGGVISITPPYSRGLFRCPRAAL